MGSRWAVEWMQFAHRTLLHEAGLLGAREVRERAEVPDDNNLHVVVVDDLKVLRRLARAETREEAAGEITLCGALHTFGGPARGKLYCGSIGGVGKSPMFVQIRALGGRIRPISGDPISGLRPRFQTPLLKVPNLGLALQAHPSVRRRGRRLRRLPPRRLETARAEVRSRRSTRRRPRGRARWPGRPRWGRPGAPPCCASAPQDLRCRLRHGPPHRRPLGPSDLVLPLPPADACHLGGGLRRRPAAGPIGLPLAPRRNGGAAVGSRLPPCGGDRHASAGLARAVVARCIALARCGPNPVGQRRARALWVAGERRG